ncbi:unnamed protein product [Trypanosoma congolense IL3000]|uniref:WGS project CAEQ00000000 data, annotated contig 575 n=1 Tax=Trypanosoma congolense (strain IL3000) TaxID=1068625 RepID=F9WGZ0_TRYCI|nr:unnamed protein product [Trypanosoma congolense IL3000]
MSGLWSFGDCNPLLERREESRSALPTSADDIIVHDVSLEKELMSNVDVVASFGGVAEVGLAVEEIQSEWVERTLGIMKEPSYHLQAHHGRSSELGEATAEGERTLAAGTCYTLNDDDMEIVRSLLKPKADTRGVKKPPKPKWHPTVPAPPTLHTAALVPRKRQHGNANSDPAEKAANNVLDGTQAKARGHATNQEGYVARRAVCDRKPCTERWSTVKPNRPVWNHVTRNQNITTALKSSATSLEKVDASHKSSGSCTAVRTGSRKATCAYDALPLEMQVTLLSLEAAQRNGWEGFYLDRLEAIARRWHRLWLKRLVWRQWRLRGCKAVECVEAELVSPTISTVACGTFNLSSEVSGRSLVSNQATAVSPYGIRLLRWYFVLWVAAIEAARERRSLNRDSFGIHRD